MNPKNLIKRVVVVCSILVALLTVQVATASGVPRPTTETGNTVTSNTPPATLTVAHFAPFASSIDATSVTVEVNGQPALTNFKFGDIQRNIELPAGFYHIVIKPTGSNNAVISATVRLERGRDYTAAAVGDGQNQRLELVAFVDNNTPNPSRTRVRIGHLAPFANTLDGTRVNICTDAGRMVFTNVPYKRILNVELVPGVYDLKVVPVANGCGTAALDLPAVNFSAGEIVDLFVIGNIANRPLTFASTTGVTTAPEPDARPATVTVAHFAPFANTVDGTSVTVRVNGGNALTNFKFGDIAKNIELPAGNYLIEILPTGTNTVAISATVTLESGKDYTAAAIGDGPNQRLEVLPLVDNNEPIADKTRARIGHLAPFANTLDGTRVNICTDAGATVFSNVAYKGVLNVELAPGVYDLKVVPVANGCGTAALDLPAVNFSAGEIVDLFVIGNIANRPLTFASTTGVTTAPEPDAKPATVTVAHFAPFANTVDGTSVTVRVNGGNALTNFKFGDIAKNIELPAGNYLIEILPTGTSTVAISATVTLESGKDYTAAAIGDGPNQRLELLPLVDNNQPIANKTRARIGHLAPFANTLDGTRVNICTDAGATVFSNVAYKGVLDLELAPGVYDLKVVPVANGCGTAALDLPAVNFSAGEIVDLFVIGNIANRPLTFASTTGVTTAPEPDAKPATVTVAHFAPFANTVDGTSVTVRVNGGNALTNFKFGDIAKNIELPAGNYLIEILPTGTNTVAISATVTLESGKDYTAAAIGDGPNQRLELLPLVDNNEPIADKTRARIGHLAPFANTLDGTRVNICTDAGATVFSNVAYKGVLDVELAPGVYDLKVVPVANGCGTAALDLPAVNFSAGEIVDLFVIGNIANRPLTFASTTGVTTAPEPDARPATVTVAHFAPFANTVDGTSVTVRVNGGNALTNFKFGDIAKNIELPAGNYLIEILPTGTNTVAISATVTLESGKDYTAAAIGDGPNQRLEVLPLVDNNEPIADKTRARIGHLAPFANTLDGTRVNICTDAGATVFSNVAYKGVLNVELAPGVYDLKVVPVANGCGTAALDLPAVNFSAGEIVDLFVIGNIANRPLTFASTTGVTTAPEPDARPATVTVAHFAPFANTVDGTSVTVRVNGGNALTNFKFGDIAKNIELPAGNYLIEILPTGTNTVAISATVTLESGKDYTAAAIGDGPNQRLELLPLVDNNEPIADKTRARIGHLAPFANTLDGTRVNICTDAGATVFSNVAYKGVLDLELAPGVYDLKVVPVANGCGTAALDLPAVNFSAGEIVDLFVIGNIANRPLTFASTTGVTTAPEPDAKPATVTVAHFAPFAVPRSATAVEVRANGNTLIDNIRFGQIRHNLTVPAGAYQLELVSKRTNSVVIGTSVTFQPDTRYLVAAIGGFFLPLEIFVLTYRNDRWERSAGADTSLLRIAHLAPLASKIDDTRIDICTDSGTLVVSDVPYRSYTTLELTAGDYDLKVSSLGANCADTVLDLPQLTLVAGEERELYTVGDGVNEPLRALFASPNAEDGVEEMMRLFLPSLNR